MLYEKKIDTRSRKAMVEFLAGHFRYHNRTTGYANRIKIPSLGLTRAQADNAYDVLSADYWDEIRDPIDDFTANMDGSYTIGIDGRSSGYLVLYESEYYDPGYKSRCKACGQLNYQPVTGEAGQCGVCRKQERVNLAKPRRYLRTKSPVIDDTEDLSEMSMSALRSRVELIREFDRACDDMRSNFIDLIDNCFVVEEVVMVPKTVKRLSCRA